MNTSQVRKIIEAGFGIVPEKIAHLDDSSGIYVNSNLTNKLRCFTYRAVKMPFKFLNQLLI